ncbi:hypothetical protein Fmac_028042 [Flemingia macrophylla]|uniref:Uncharacterized protein n=1 Tax=Flemingia macrophylla TaxID=520843 RepID=A0ABD1LJP3_9FABA
MAPSFTNVNLLSALVAHGFSKTLTRRGYAAVATQSATRGGGGGKIAPKSGEDKVEGAEKVSWVPDPITGYYKPENIKEVDVAELRATLTSKKFNH